MKKLHIAIIQQKPEHLNLQACTSKALGYIGEAASQGASLVVFGETWLSGYPSWLDHCPEVAIWNSEATKEVFAQMHKNSVDVNGEEMKLICDSAKEHKLIICIGINEKVSEGIGSGTIYNSFVIISEEGSSLLS